MKYHRSVKSFVQLVSIALLLQTVACSLSSENTNYLESGSITLELALQAPDSAPMGPLLGYLPPKAPEQYLESGTIVLGNPIAGAHEQKFAPVLGFFPSWLWDSTGSKANFQVSGVLTITKRLK